MRFGAKAPRPPQWPGQSATLHSHATFHPQFVGPGNAAHFLIRAAKPSHTTGTLCEIYLEFFGILEYIKKNMHTIYGNSIYNFYPPEKNRKLRPKIVHKQSFLPQISFCSAKNPLSRRKSMARGICSQLCMKTGYIHMRAKFLPCIKFPYLVLFFHSLRRPALN
jgi:hypothetical protein